MRRTFPTFLLACMLPLSAGASVDLDMVNRIVDEGMRNSQIPETAAYLTDRIGGRITNSPQMRQAEQWTQSRFREWGLPRVYTEGFEFGRGWSFDSTSARMVSPRRQQLRSIPIAWTPGTGGVISAPIVVAPMSRESHFAEWKGKLQGKIVLVSLPTTGSEPDQAPFRRLTGEELAKRDVYRQPKHSEAERERARRRANFESKLDAFLAAEGAVAWVRQSYRDGGLVHGAGYGFLVGQTQTLPGVELAAEDYRLLARLAKTDANPVLELDNDARFHDEDTQAYNVFAEIPGRDARAGYVMAGAHLDSWGASGGANDNASGSVVVMEAARILHTLGVRTKRAIRFALWSGEEQGLHGSLNYVDRHLVTRPQPTDPEIQALPFHRAWNLRWPLTPRPGYADMAAYFNIDNGSGKVRGINAEGNAAVVPIFRQWLAPFAPMGATTVAAGTTGATDHVYFQAVGLPGYQFIQDPLDYSSRLHHSSVDSYDHLKIDDLKQAAVILASLLYQAAQRDEPLPRMPLPTRPTDTDPFEYLEPED